MALAVLIGVRGAAVVAAAAASACVSHVYSCRPGLCRLLWLLLALLAL